MKTSSISASPCKFLSSGIERSWNLRVAAVTELESDELLADLDQFLNQPRYTYQHCWNVGDLLVIDNTGALHGRTAISEGGVRVLFSGQVNRSVDYDVEVYDRSYLF